MAFYRNRPRRATLAEWTSVNPTLMLGEMAIITPDTGTGTGKVKVKFGDGVSSFNSLPYAYNEEEIDIDALISDFTESSTETDAVSGDTYGVIIGKFVKSIKTFRTNISNIVGNIGTIANLLTTDKSSLVNAVNELKNGKIEKANIVNNTVTTVSGTVLDGRMGKILQDQITEQNNNLTLSPVEHKIGTINGVDLFQKTVEITVNNTEWTFTQPIFTIDPPTNVWIDLGNSYMSNGIYKFPINYSEAGYQNFARVAGTTSVDLYVGTTFPSGTFTFVLSLKYTK